MILAVLILQVATCAWFVARGLAYRARYFKERDRRRTTELILLERNEHIARLSASRPVHLSASQQTMANLQHVIDDLLNSLKTSAIVAPSEPLVPRQVAIAELQALESDLAADD